VSGTPQRIQRKREKGWRKPPGAVCVTRPGRYGNPFAVSPVDRHGMHPFGWVVKGEPSVAAHGHVYRTEVEAAARAVELFRIEVQRAGWVERLAELRGKDLACWCKPGGPCHADVLLELANKEER